MSLWQAPFRPPAIRSKAVVRAHRSAAGGDAAGYAPQPISPPDIIPLKRGFWVTYGTQTLACVLGLALCILFVRAYWANDAYSWLAITAAAVMVIIPIFLYTRWRKMERIFGAEMYDSSEGKRGDEDEASPSSEELVKRHPNRGQILDGTEVTVATVLLIFTACVQGLVGCALLFVESPTADPMFPGHWNVYAAGLVLQSAINVALMVATMRHVVGAPRLALYVSVVGIVLSLSSLHWMAIAASIIAAVLFWRVHRAFQMMLARVAEPEKKDPLEAYYHNLLQLLVWVMRADGHCDRRELRKIKSTCDAMNLSDWERDVVIASANLDSRKELRNAAKRYQEAAAATNIHDAGSALVVVATAVTGADGVIVNEEAEAVRGLGKLVGVSQDTANQVLLQQQLHLEALDTPKAHELLHLDDGATRAQVEAAHEALAAELEETRYQHIGTTLADQLHQRHAMLDRARDLLLQEASG